MTQLLDSEKLFLTCKTKWIDRKQWLRENWMTSSLESQWKGSTRLHEMSWWNMGSEYQTSPPWLLANLLLTHGLFFSLTPLFMKQPTNSWNRIFLQWPLDLQEIQLLSVMMRIDSMNQWSSKGVMLWFLSSFLIYSTCSPCSILISLVLYLPIMCSPHVFLMLLCNIPLSHFFPHCYLLSSSPVPHVILYIYE